MIQLEQNRHFQLHVVYVIIACTKTSFRYKLVPRLAEETSLPRGCTQLVLSRALVTIFLTCVCCIYFSTDRLETQESTEENSKGDDSLSCQEKFMVIRQMLPGLIPIYIAWFSEYMIIQSVITTLAFPNAPFRPRDHYQYYIFVFLGGEVVGRSYLVALSYIKPEWAEKAKFPYLWVLSTIEVMHLLFFVLAAWYRFLPSVWIVLLLSFTGGVTIGVFFVNALAFFRGKFEDRYQEFAMGYIVVAMGGGTFTASLVGLVTEPLLRRHCVFLLNNDDYCFTRSKAREHIMSHCLGKPD